MKYCHSMQACRMLLLALYNVKGNVFRPRMLINGYYDGEGIPNRYLRYMNATHPYNAREIGDATVHG